MNARALLRPEKIAPALILGVAALLRFWYLDAIEHNIDHAFPIHQALRTLDEGYLPLVGQETSVLFANPPLTGYLYVPVLALWRSPVAVYLLVIGVNTLAVCLVYRTARALLGEARAWIAAGLMAVNPWAIEYSRATWVQGLVPFFACLTAYWLFPALAGKAKRPARDLVAALVALTLLTQTYLPAFVAVVQVAALLLIFRKRVPWRAALAGGLIFAAALALYGAGLLANWERTQAKLDVFLNGGGAPGFRDEAWWHAIRLVSGDDYAIARGTSAPIRDVEVRQSLSQAAGLALTLALAAGAALAVARAWQRREGWEAGVIALVWFIIPPLLMTVVAQPVHPFYLLVTLPAGYLLAAMGIGLPLRLPSPLNPLSRLRRTSAPKGKGDFLSRTQPPPLPLWERGAGGEGRARRTVPLQALVLAVCGVALALLCGINSARYYQETRAIPGAHALSALPLSDGLRLGATINDLLGEGPRLLSIDIDAEIVSSLSGRLTRVARDQRFPTLTRVFPWPGGVTAIFSAGGQPPMGPVGADRLDAATLQLADGTVIWFYRHERAGRDPAWFPDGGQRVEWPTDRGLTLAWWVWERETLVTGWRVDALPRDYAEWLLGPFVHVFDESGRRLGVYSGEATPGYDWIVGQLYMQRIAMPGGPDAGAYFEAGLYDAIRQQNAIFSPPEGEPAIAYRIDGTGR